MTGFSTSPFIRLDRKEASRRQIDAAIAHLKKFELECAITLAAAAETMLPPTEEPHIFAYLKQHPSFKAKEVDFNETTNWLKHHIPPDTAFIYEFEAAVIIVRAMSKFAAVYNEGPAEWDDFLKWCVSKGFWPEPPTMDLTGE